SLFELEHQPDVKRAGAGARIGVERRPRAEEVTRTHAADEIDRTIAADISEARSLDVAGDDLVPEAEPDEGVDLRLVELEVVVRRHADRHVAPAGERVGPGVVVERGFDAEDAVAQVRQALDRLA